MAEQAATPEWAVDLRTAVCVSLKRQWRNNEIADAAAVDALIAAAFDAQAGKLRGAWEQATAERDVLRAQLAATLEAKRQVEERAAKAEAEEPGDDAAMAKARLWLKDCTDHGEVRLDLLAGKIRQRESTVESMAKAMEVEAIDDCACHCCVQRVARARAALASWRGLTGGDRG